MPAAAWIGSLRGCSGAVAGAGRLRLLLEAISDASPRASACCCCQPLALWKASPNQRLDRLPWLSALLFLLALLAWRCRHWVANR